tara:strand:- start:411 stop:650 length:240 start_codon:yes stop_codon:yes gene_type:complete
MKKLNETKEQRINYIKWRQDVKKRIKILNSVFNLRYFDATTKEGLNMADEYAKKIDDDGFNVYIKWLYNNQKLLVGYKK